MTNIQYYSHLLLNSRYSFIIKLIIIFSIYMLFYADNINDIAYCAKTKGTARISPDLAESKTSATISPIGDIFELERMKVHEKIIAYTNMEPYQLLEGFKKWKSENTGSFRGRPLYLQEKSYLHTIIPGPVEPYYHEKVHYLLRMYRRLNNISK